MASADINLLKTKSDFQPVIALVEKYIRVVSIGSVSVVLVLGLLLGLSYFLIINKRDTLVQERKALITQVEGNVKKESLLFLLRERLTTIGSIIETQRSFAPYIDTTLTILGKQTLVSFSLGEKNAVRMDMTVGSVEETVDVLTTVIDMEAKHTIINPVLENYMVDGGGRVQIALSYTVVL